MNQKDSIVAALARAKSDLEQAMDNLEKLPVFEPGTVAFAAHTLSNYLMVSSGTIELLILELTNHPDPQIRIWLEGLQQATTLMSHTVAQLINNSVGDPKLLFSEVDVVAMARRARDYYQRVADRKQIAIVCESNVAAADVWVDRVALAAILDNLLSNAVKYSLPSKRIWLRIQAEVESVVCSVRDEGPGLSAEDQAKLFQKGVRLSAVPTGGEPSTGYGLAVARDLIDRLSSTIWCESRLGQGATFSIRLPTSQRPGQGLGENPVPG
jgi:signal transduction histidine kinase